MNLTKLAAQCKGALDWPRFFDLIGKVAPQQEQHTTTTITTTTTTAAAAAAAATQRRRRPAT